MNSAVNSSRIGDFQVNRPDSVRIKCGEMINSVNILDKNSSVLSGRMPSLKGVVLGIYLILSAQ